MPLEHRQDGPSRQSHRMPKHVFDSIRVNSYDTHYMSHGLSPEQIHAYESTYPQTAQFREGQPNPYDLQASGYTNEDYQRARQRYTSNDRSSPAPLPSSYDNPTSSSYRPSSDRSLYDVPPPPYPPTDSSPSTSSTSRHFEVWSPGGTLHDVDTEASSMTQFAQTHGRYTDYGAPQQKGRATDQRLSTAVLTTLRSGTNEHQESINTTREWTREGLPHPPKEFMEDEERHFEVWSPGGTLHDVDTEASSMTQFAQTHGRYTDYGTPQQKERNVKITAVDLSRLKTGNTQGYSTNNIKNWERKGDPHTPKSKPESAQKGNKIKWGIK
jgi:hypothetical protein